MVDHTTATPDSQILTWTSTGSIRPPLLQLPGPGLMNVGNTCYANSVLQVLFHTDDFRVLILLSRLLDFCLKKLNQ